MNDSWFERDDFWQGLEAKIYTSRQEEAAPEEAEAAMKLIGVPPGHSVLDLCCGNGRHSFALQAMGYRATGVDLSRTYLARAHQRAADMSNPPAFVLADIRSHTEPASFDAAVMLWNSFGYFESEDDDARALQNVFAALVPGGSILIQTHGRESTARKFVPKDWFEIGSTVVLDERWIESEWSRMRTRYVVIDQSGARTSHTMSCRLYSPNEVRGLLTRAGFTAIRSFGALDGRPYDERAFELVVTAVKPTA